MSRSYHDIMGELIASYGESIGIQTVVQACAYRHAQHCQGYRSDYGPWQVLAEMDCSRRLPWS